MKPMTYGERFRKNFESYSDAFLFYFSKTFLPSSFEFTGSVSSHEPK